MLPFTLIAVSLYTFVSWRVENDKYKETEHLLCRSHVQFSTPVLIIRTESLLSFSCIASFPGKTS
jgi:hypothetical protein